MEGGGGMDVVFTGVWLEALASFVVWLVANGVYVDMRRTGRRGFRRLLAFWLGTPTTWLTLLAVREGVSPDLETPPDDEEALLAEIRRDRSLRTAADRDAVSHGSFPSETRTEES